MLEKGLVMFVCEEPDRLRERHLLCSTLKGAIVDFSRNGAQRRSSGVLYLDSKMLIFTCHKVLFFSSFANIVIYCVTSQLAMTSVRGSGARRLCVEWYLPS